jgi:membrane associated rhomboid family serine protease
MAFRSNGPISLSLPAFRGVTRRIILIALCVFLGSLVLDIVSHDTAAFLINTLMLHPGPALHRLIFEFVSYPFMSQGLLSTAFALLSIWFFGSVLEDERGSRWLTEYFLSATIGGGFLVSIPHPWQSASTVCGRSCWPWCSPSRASMLTRNCVSTSS